MPKPSAINREAASFRSAESAGFQWSAFIGPLCILILMASVWSGRDRLAFRDVSHFYTPLYQYVGERCAERPLSYFWTAMWNPLDQTGMPLAGETTTAVYYPVRHLVYSLPFPSNESRGEQGAIHDLPEELPEDASLALAVYVTLHLILASLAAFWAARRLGCEPASSVIASLIYPLSGSVLFLTTNPPFLVGAAWLPLSLVPLLDSSHRGWKLPTVALAMMVLGGDPQTALHESMVAGLWWLLNGVIAVCKRESWQESLSGLLRLVGVAAGSAVLATPQIAASLSWARHSGRVWSEHEASQSFAFSVAPWRWLELAMPALFGSPWPVNHRWDRPLLLGTDVSPIDALWTPSLYVGLSALILVAVCFYRRDPKQVRGLAVWIFVLLTSGLAAMGWYGPGHAPYRWLMDWVPGYEAFRYPAKWLPFGTLALAIMAARGAQILFQQAGKFEPRLQRVIEHRAALIGAVVMSGGLLSSVCIWQALNSIDAVAADRVWGPFQIDEAWLNGLGTIVHVLVVATIANLCWVAMQFRTQPSVMRWGWVALVACDLLVAHWNLVPTIDRTAELAAWRDLDHSEDMPEQATRWIRTAGSGEYPAEWTTTSDPQRLLAMEVHDRHRWYGRWHLVQEAAVFNSVVSIRPWTIDQFWTATRQHPTPIDWQQTAAWLGVGGSRSPSGKVHVWPTQSIRLHGRDQVKLEREIPWSKRMEMASETGDQADSIAVPAAAFTAGRTDETFVSRRVYQDGGWRAELLAQDSTVDPISIQVFAADGIGQGVWCPPGSWTIRWIYQPPWHTGSVVVGIWGWLAMVVVSVRCICRGRSWTSSSAVHT
ncbi:MAG: hypothetical protein ACF8AM_18350 [Rhodopirellula sp. JB055]|uniref:hypothetical protein n=1 Tax=Rhodopirellula sp. JB055 TaxID=3342846 RepID=UPI00370CE125